MRDILANSLFFGAFITILFMWLGIWLIRRFHINWLPPILLDLLFVLAVLILLDISYEEYNRSAQHLGNLLTPATVALAVPLYRQREHLRLLWREIISGVLVGTVSCMTIILLSVPLFGLNECQYITLLPKSITAAISLVMSEEMGGVAAITVVATTITGTLGAACASPLLRLLNITEPVARGVAIGTSSHAIGTARAIEIGETEGAISGLAMALTGLASVVLVPLFAQFVI